MFEGLGSVWGLCETELACFNAAENGIVVLGMSNSIGASWRYTVLRLSTRPQEILTTHAHIVK